MYRCINRDENRDSNYKFIIYIYLINYYFLKVRDYNIQRICKLLVQTSISVY